MTDGVTFRPIFLVPVIFSVLNTDWMKEKSLSKHGEIDSDVEDFDVDDGPDYCPRHKEEAEAKGRDCLRKCKNDADCISAKKRCLCDGMCGWSCVRPDLHCEDLSPPEHGILKVTGEHFGQKASFSCQEGYWLAGNTERVCQGDAKWSGKQPECKLKVGIVFFTAMCVSPPQVAYARHSAPLDKDDFPTDSTVQYTCFPGYDPKGFPKAKCLNYNGTAQWFGPDLRCLPRSCGPPGDIENGRREGSQFTFTNRVTYYCNVGFELIGRSHRYCQSNGQWSGTLPSCRAVICPVPENPPNGRAFYTSLSYNAVVKYECRYGYKLVGQATRTCNTSKQWEGTESTCEEIKCKDPGPFYNGYFEGRSFNLMTTLTFHCYEGMRIVGSKSVTCKQDGNWSKPFPQCLAPCIVPEMEHGNFTDYVPGSKVPHGYEMNITCEPRYDVILNATPVVCSNGTWTHVPRAGELYTTENTVARRRLQPHSFRKSHITDFDCSRILASTITRLRTNHFKGMQILPDKIRTYIPCKNCTDIQLTPDHILQCPALTPYVLQLGMVPLASELREILYSNDVER
nr:protein lev-9-like [Parasteatoda tepidariorum]